MSMDPLHKIARYEIRGTLGEGGMALVYAAWDPVLQRNVALKIVDKARLDAERSHEVLARFKREAQAAARLAHANIVAVYEYGEEGDLAYIVMEYVTGKPLTAYMAEGLHNEPARVRDIIASLLDALGYSHEQGIVHRDIKPGNILITLDGAIKVLDFGIARVESSNLTQRGDMLGTPSYMSPEQYLGDASDGRTDQFSAAVILYELATGMRPFRGESNGQIMQKVLYETPNAPSQLNPLLPPALDWVVLKALAKEADDRFAHAREFRRALLEAIPPASGGAIGVASTVNGQSAMHQTVRRLRSLAQPMSASVGVAADPRIGSGEQGALPRTRILFVDDEERILSALRTVFRGRYHVLTAANGQEALEFISRFRIPVIVSDQRMPGMPGVELLRRARELSPDSVRILLTGYSDLASIVGSINEGEVYRFVSKPWDNQELQHVVGEAATIGGNLLERTRHASADLPRVNAAVLALGGADDLFPLLASLLGGSHELLHAESIQAALGVLESREVAVLVADIDAEAEHHLIFFNLLKRKYPQILVLVVTSASDSELMIHLINEAQVYRFLNTPLDETLLRQHLASALRSYAEYQRSPELLQRHRVRESGKVRDSGFGRLLLDRLKSLKNRFVLVAK